MHICYNEILGFMLFTSSLPVIGWYIHQFLHWLRGDRKCDSEPCKLSELKCEHDTSPSSATAEPNDA